MSKTITRHVTDDMLRHVLMIVLPKNNQTKRAHSYNVLQMLMKLFPHAYVKQMNEYLHCQDPIQQGHSDIMSWLNHPPFDELVTKDGTIEVDNVRGGKSTVALWRGI